MKKTCVQQTTDPETNARCWIVWSGPMPGLYLTCEGIFYSRGDALKHKRLIDSNDVKNEDKDP